jgi:hypothetical protein
MDQDVAPLSALREVSVIVVGVVVGRVSVVGVGRFVVVVVVPVDSMLHLPNILQISPCV